MSLSECVNLAIAHTGSTTLTSLLKPYSTWTHHLHQIGSQYLINHGFRCIIYTLRDPVKRLESAFEFEKTHINWGRNKHLFSKYRNTLRLRDFVDSIRNNSIPSHNSTYSIWLNSQNPIWGKMGKESMKYGNSGLVPQSWYIRRMNENVTWNVLCSHRLMQDWNALLKKMNVSNMFPNTTLIKNKSKKKELLDAARAKYVRETLFLEDTRLVFSKCGSSAFI